jgi:hypothetical protein
MGKGRVRVRVMGRVRVRGTGRVMETGRGREKAKEREQQQEVAPFQAPSAQVREGRASGGLVWCSVHIILALVHMPWLTEKPPKPGHKPAGRPTHIALQLHTREAAPVHAGPEKWCENMPVGGWHRWVQCRWAQVPVPPAPSAGCSTEQTGT